MKRVKPLYFLILLCCTCILGRCSKDKGNYEYATLNPVEIDVQQTASAYSLLRFDTLNITPTVKYKGQTVNPANSQFPELKFSWDMYAAQINRTVMDRHHLSDSIALKTVMNQRELVWEILFTVTNTETGVKAFSKFAVAITPSLAEGWMVLYEREGNTDVGMITNNEISKTQVNEKLYLDIYSSSNGAPLAGSPGSLIYSAANLNAMRIYVQSSQDIALVGLNTFERIYSFNNGLFWTKPAISAPALVTANTSRKEFIINNNQLHIIDYSIIAPGERAFNDGLSGNYGKLASWMAAAPASPFDAILYDQTNKRFVKVATRGTEIVPIARAQSTTAPFDVNNVGMEFVMADMGWNNYEYSVMKDQSGNYFLLSSNFREGETAFIGKGKYNMSACPEISNINSVTAGYLGEVFYYSANKSLYQFKYTTGTTSQLWTAPGGETITNISLQKYCNPTRNTGVLYDPKNLCKILYIATYNEATKLGTVYQMQVNPTSGAILPDTEKKYTGFGKIKSMAWKINIVR